MGQFKSTQLSFAAKKNVFHETDVMNLSSFQDLPPRRMFRLPGTTFIQLPNLSNNYHFFADWFMRTMYNVMREGSDVDSFGPESEHNSRNLLLFMSSTILRKVGHKPIQSAYFAPLLFGRVLHKPVEGLLRSAPTLCFEKLIWPLKQDPQNVGYDVSPWYELTGAHGFDDKWAGVLPKLRSYVWSQLGIQEPQPRNPNRAPRITYVPRTDDRRIYNDAVLIDAMKSYGWEVKAMNFDASPEGLKSAIETLSESDVLMGVHGAGLAYAWLLPPTSILVELSHSFGNSLGIFRNVAVQSNVGYYRVDISKDTMAGSAVKDKVVIGQDTMDLLKVKIPQWLTKVNAGSLNSRDISCKVEDKNKGKFPGESTPYCVLRKCHCNGEVVALNQCGKIDDEGQICCTKRDVQNCA
ncbi:hypothetical protein TrLO_g3697 [Triparma laevis f. longispina]|uniref:Glycosyltransferase 61 catalytic domain-containing protein n=1 Tax=Triparma laevis f. longispina TaxID=1714387 RepID=A0A9W7FIP6_9STRA|nr:hypothetical protein TrLO_g3697 [Triparma laevis f. longispina]